MNKAIVGSRTLEHHLRARQLVTRLIAEARQQYGRDLVIISGGAIGIDRMAEDDARRLGISCTVYRPKGVGWPAYKARNDLIAEACDELDCIWDPNSKTSGCLYTADKAKALGKKVEVHRVEGIRYGR